MTNALFVCFGGMSNVGTLTGLAGREVAQGGEATIFCLASLACGDPVVRQKTEQADRIVTIDGCPLACSRRIVEEAGFEPDHSIVVTRDLGVEKASPSSIQDRDVSALADRIRLALAESGDHGNR